MQHDGQWSTRAYMAVLPKVNSSALGNSDPLYDVGSRSWLLHVMYRD